MTENISTNPSAAPASAQTLAAEEFEPAAEGAEELLHAAGRGIDPLFERPLASVTGRTPVSCAPDTPIRAVLTTMSRERIGSLVVVDPGRRPVGIFTFHDLLDRVVLPELPLDRPVREAMSTRLWTLPPGAPVLDAVLLMAREGIRHVPLVEAGELVGLVSESRLFSVTRGGIRETRAAIRGAESVPEVARVVAEMRAFALGLFEHGMGADAVTRLVTAFNDVVAERLIELLDDRGLFGSGNACWIVMGSEGRTEQTLATDQDNGLVLDDAIDASSRAALLDLGRRVNEALDECGYPLCKGGIMAGNPECCLTLSEWRSRFGDWIERGDPKALLNAAIYFDFRPVHGDLDLAARLRAWLVDAAREHGRFLLQLTHNAQENQPPLGLVRDFVVSGSGEHPGTLDLKVNGVQPVVEAARIYALAAGVAATNTVERLRAAAVVRRIPESEVEGWIEAFRFVQRLRLGLNVAQAGRGEALHNFLDPDTLNDLERRVLKESLRQVKKLQTRLARDFGAGASGFGA